MLCWQSLVGIGTKLPNIPHNENVMKSAYGKHSHLSPVFPSLPYTPSEASFIGRKRTFTQISEKIMFHIPIWIRKNSSESLLPSDSKPSKILLWNRIKRSFSLKHPDDPARAVMPVQPHGIHSKSGSSKHPQTFLNLLSVPFPAQLPLLYFIPYLLTSSLEHRENLSYILLRKSHCSGE